MKKYFQGKVLDAIKMGKTEEELKFEEEKKIWRACQKATLKKIKERKKLMKLIKKEQKKLDGLGCAPEEESSIRLLNGEIEVLVNRMQKPACDEEVKKKLDELQWEIKKIKGGPNNGGPCEPKTNCEADSENSLLGPLRESTIRSIRIRRRKRKEMEALRNRDCPQSDIKDKCKGLNGKVGGFRLFRKKPPLEEKESSSCSE